MMIKNLMLKAVKYIAMAKIGEVVFAFVKKMLGRKDVRDKITSTVESVVKSVRK